ncbi:Arrestin-C domain-containing protein [Mycena sanguinolenta]|uniref:Arrestin-C domain-containing protein n=1 Tax=Mycena sanguinolenta TaxID=230812 RepID=A0A8H7CXL1_9AGAR|nr:Arrestin-C domain-containing protein [Mycena sanguinolenta]
MTKNTLTIRLTEAAVFLRTSENNARRRSPEDGSDSRPSMLRGLLTLNIASSWNLQAKSSTTWPEGIGARRVDVQEEQKVFSESIVYFRAGPAPRRTASVGPGVDPQHDDDCPLDTPSRPETPRFDDFQQPRSVRATRRVSADLSYFHNYEAYEHAAPPPIPPYTPLPTPPSSHTSPAQSSGHLVRTDSDAAHALEDFRNALRVGLSSANGIRGDRSPATSSFREFDRSLSRRPSVETLAEVDENHREAASGGSNSVDVAPRSNSPSRTRGRRARFSLGSVSSALLDVVHSGSSKARSSKERSDSNFRGRAREKAVRDDGPSKERPALDIVAGLRSSDDGKDKDKSSWKEFKKGTYTFPISFAIPPNAPPTMECPYGSVVWRLKANVHRPGAFASRMHAMRQVLVIAAPMEDDTEESETIIVERHWEQQLQYLISISGRSFPIGSTIPVSFTMMPLSKVKIHRISILLEEKIDYHSQMKRVARSDPIVRIALLSVKHDDKLREPILPLESNDVEALQKSPLLALTAPGDDLSELASQWMGPGPWTFHQELQLPASCSLLHFTNKNRLSHMSVTHLIKYVMRVERGDDTAMDPKTGKRKLFDIVVQTPVHILSCRCNPEWMSLPRYCASFEDPDHDVAPNCPCEAPRSGLKPVVTRNSTDSASAAETSPVHATMPSLHPADTLFARNTLFEHLVSGQENELGEAPPAYNT